MHLKVLFFCFVSVGSVPRLPLSLLSHMVIDIVSLFFNIDKGPFLVKCSALNGLSVPMCLKTLIHLLIHAPSHKRAPVGYVYCMNLFSMDSGLWVG